MRITYPGLFTGPRKRIYCAWYIYKYVIGSKKVLEAVAVSSKLEDGGKEEHIPASSGTRTSRPPVYLKRYNIMYICYEMSKMSFSYFI